MAEVMEMDTESTIFQDHIYITLPHRAETKSNMKNLAVTYITQGLMLPLDLHNLLLIYFAKNICLLEKCVRDIFLKPQKLK